ncbi:MAG TPA: TlpA disulfide reductase family protein [Candidatus Thermoplasmatota archaeon]|nr:TlpA disulfide reductase family protein [Candidatus Thermoplasmatota archaeon]
MRLAPWTLLAGLVLAGCAGDAPAATRKAPDWSFVDLDGAVHSRDAPPGNATVLFFMATWCGTCKEEAPMMAELHDDYAPRGVRFYSLDFDASEPPEAVRAWQARYAQDWPHGLDRGMAVQRAFDVTGQSSVAVLDAQGGVVKVWSHGYAREAAVRAALDAVLADAA